jgi:glycosyltransferase involved in cell wall biosynthesis/acetyltransferase-like isoleucine patch superfamily enzyme
MTPKDGDEQQRYTHIQESAYASPWTIGQRIRMLAWQICWSFFCRWTPKPFNRWRLGWLKIFGANVSGTSFVHQRARIQIPWNLTLHDRACLGDGANAYSLGRIEIHKGATVAQEAYLCTGTHDFDDRHTPLVTAPIVIGAYAFIAARAFVMPGVTIGEGAVLGAMSLANRDLSPWTIYAGTPAKRVNGRKQPALRVNIVQGAFLPVPPLQGGAVEKVWDALGRQLERLGCEVTHVSRQYGDLPHKETRDGVRHLRVAGFDACANALLYKLRDLRYSLRVWRMLPPADITVTNTFWLPILLRRSKHGAIYVHVARFPRKQMRLYSHVKRLQSVSETVAAAIRLQTPSVAQLVKVLPNPISDGWFVKDIGTVNTSPLVILYVGRLHPEKGIDILIDAFARLPEDTRGSWKLALVGSASEKAGGGGDQFLASLKRLAAIRDLRIEFVGPVYDAEALKAQYDRASLFVYPSRAVNGEAFGLAPLEAMARGVATITSSLDCFTEFIRHGQNGWVFSLDAADPAQALSDALRTLTGSTVLRQALQREGLKTAHEYAVDRVAERYLQDFEQVANG